MGGNAKGYGREEDNMHEDMKNFIRDLKTVNRNTWKS